MTSDTSRSPSAGTGADRTSGGEASRAESTRARLVQAAVEAFAAKGFHGTTTRDIAAAAGMSPAALYVHHRSKEELLHQISRAGHQDTLDLVLEAIASSPDPVEQLRRLMHEFAAHHAAGHTAARVVNYELAALSPEHLEEIMALRHRIDAEVQGLVEAGVEAGAFDAPDPRIASAALLSLGIDIARWYDDRAGWTPQLVSEEYSRLALRIVGADPARGEGPQP